MLNELLQLTLGMQQAGLVAGGLHPDLRRPKRDDCVLVRLSGQGEVKEIAFLPADRTAELWKLSNGQHNSFPFVQVKSLLAVPADKGWRDKHKQEWRALDAPCQREWLALLAEQYPCAGGWREHWPESSLRQRLQERLTQLASLEQMEAAAVPAVIRRFLDACAKPSTLLQDVARMVLLETSEGGDEWLEPAHRLLVEGGGLYFDVLRGEFLFDVQHPSQRDAISEALFRAEGGPEGICALTGTKAALLQGSLPQPNLPNLGQTFLFSRNSDIPACGRYGRFDAASFPVGGKIAGQIYKAVEELTTDYRRGKTWLVVPGERPKQRDLLLAFVRQVPDAPIIDLIADDGSLLDPVSTYETRTCLVMQAIKAKVPRDFRRLPVEVCLLRAVDKANRKAIFHRCLSVGQLFNAASAWRIGEENLPPWFTLVVPGENREPRAPPHIAPLELPALTRRRYVNGGERVLEVIGATAADAFSLFLGEDDGGRMASSLLRRYLRSHGILLSATLHALRRLKLTPSGAGTKSLDPQATLRATTLFGILLARLDRIKERYMSEAAFKLGQLLAAADEVHLGYCADARDGAVPPTLLGNAVLSVAQANPQKALAVLCARWKPYGAWAKRPDLGHAASLCGSLEESKQRRGWAIRRGRRHMRLAKLLAEELHGQLPAVADDAFRAELLLGYVAGLPAPDTDKNDNADEG